MDLIRSAKAHSKTSIEALVGMRDCLEDVNVKFIPGDIVECGVWAGGNLILSRSICPDRKIWAYDTFVGMTKPTEVDRLRNGRFALAKWPKENWMGVSLEDVKKNITDSGNSLNSFKFVSGDVCKTLELSENLPDQIALLRLDTDWYESTKKELEALWPRLVVGGHLIVDDYGHWMGAKQAVDEFFSPEVRSRMEMFDYTVAHLVKQ